MKSLGKNQLQSIKPTWLLAGLAVLAALWFAWNGWQELSSAHVQSRVDAARAASGAEVVNRLQAAVAELEGRRGRLALATALQREDLSSAENIIKGGWDGVEAVEWHDPGLATAYEDPRAFGYGKLGVLELSIQDNASRAAVVMDGGAARLAVAAPVLSDGRVLSVVYVRLPLEQLTGPLSSADLSSNGYLALRQGRHNVFERGDTSLAGTAEFGAVPVPGTRMRVVSAAPAGNGGSMLTSFLLAGLCLAVGAGALLQPHLKFARRKAGDEDEAPAVADGPTLAELQASGQLKAPPPEEEGKPAMQKPPMPPVPGMPEVPRAVLDRSIFRAYDIRGVVGKTLDEETARLIGQAIGSVMHEQDARSIVVGRDGRLSSPRMAAALIDGLRRAGREVIDIGEAPTPVTYFAAYHLRAGSCVSVTGSHNPPDYNGFKIVIEGETLAGDAIQNLYERIAENQLHTASEPGLASKRDIAADYINRIAGDIQIERKIKVVVDCGSGIAGAIAPQLLEAIGAEVEPLFCEVDGNFPHHHPDPSDPANLQDLVNVVQRVDADLGLAFDGDGDRLGVVTKSGEMIYPDRLLMLFAADVLERNPGACVIYDVKCTGHLAMHILRHGGSPLMWKTGHSLIKSKMRETEAELAGEMSGHFFFRERWYGFDDGLYAAARLLEILSSRGETPQEVFDTLPKGVSTPELKIHVEEGRQYTFIEEFLARAKFEGARIATIDGLRADWPDGWGLVRASNTTPVLVLRFDAKDEDALRRIKEAFREQLLAVDGSLHLPF
ncbi:phosphomannomutase/phosphoglucomutase [Arenimonas caeni]|jgi:phosphomannomutase/phosphoglucomutase|uniref:phosphomannomutase/phosphoglucomutase n=1 Tax=Arenimonas caeni TaxID=2058085 RepID=UPI002A35C83D|nr:phosphomannomutase/phosphoglucomutase [Arenimonas caeni]MDY0021161.1 phosphomannomutase/phosphoglucomutase [Arenimonas caeni]